MAEIQPFSILLILPKMQCYLFNSFNLKRDILNNLYYKIMIILSRFRGVINNKILIFLYYYVQLRFSRLCFQLLKLFILISFYFLKKYELRKQLGEFHQLGRHMQSAFAVLFKTLLWFRKGEERKKRLYL